MQSPRDTDGNSTHRRAIRFHVAKLRSVDTPLHKQLFAEGKAVYENLKIKVRATEDTEDDAVEAAADADTTEIAFENAIRALDDALAQLDRDKPGLNARHAVFPEGFGAVIDPEGEEQLKILPALHVRLGPFQNEPDMSKPLARLDAAETAFKQALNVETQANAAIDTAFEEERAARRAVREQLQSAHGRLRDFYKSRPAQAELFFLKLGVKGSKGKAPKEGGGNEGGGTPGGGGTT